jgi:hypothetical protein
MAGSKSVPMSIERMRRALSGAGRYRKNDRM